MKLKKDNVYGFLIIHLIAGLAVFPWFFSWTGVVLLVAGLFVFGMLGINLCFHRLLTHRSFSCPLWLERSLATLAVCSVQDSPPHWVAAHRKHHQFADEEQDPHSPLVSFFWAHMGWLLVKVDDMKRGPLIERYAKDISRDRYYAWLERRSNWLKVALLSWLGFFAAGFTVVALSGGSFAEAAQFGRHLPLGGLWGHVNPRFQTPANAAVAVGILAAIPILLVGPIGGITLSIAATGLIYLSYFLCNIGLAIARRRGWPHQKAYFSLGRWGMPVNILALIWGAVMLINIGLWASPELFGDFGGEGRGYWNPLINGLFKVNGQPLDGLPAWPLFESLVGLLLLTGAVYYLVAIRGQAADIEADAITGEGVIG